MPGATLSRWTMSYFAAACLFLALGEALMAAGYGYPQAGPEAPETLGVVHLVTAGWLGLLMSGALLQFVPVLVAKPLRGDRLALPALLLIVLGDTALVSGFGGLAAQWNNAPFVLVGGALALSSGYLLVAAMLALTLWQARPLPLVGRFVAVGLVSLGLTVMLGTGFGFLLSGYDVPDRLAGLLPDGLILHVALGLGGWMGFSAIGVSYRLLSMFLLTPEVDRRTSRAVWWAGTIALLGVALCAAALVGGLERPALPLAVALMLGLLATALYCGDLLSIYRARRRRHMELNSLASIGAFGALFASVTLLIVMALLGSLTEGAAPIVYLVIFGWLSGLGLAQLYKITPFLTWLECYGPLLGRVQTPRVQDIVKERRAFVWFTFFYAGVAVATAALGLGWPLAFRTGAAFQFVATLALIVEYARARLLCDVPAALRLPLGAIRPNLFLPTPDPRRQP